MLRRPGEIDSGEAVGEWMRLLRVLGWLSVVIVLAIGALFVIGG
jgi:hypothetical protein